MAAKCFQLAGLLHHSALCEIGCTCTKLTLHSLSGENE